MTLLECVCSLGGPILAIPSELASSWRGNLAPLGVEVPAGWTWGDGGVRCDYDRACDDSADFVGIDDLRGTWSVPVGEGRALVLDGEESTAAVPWEGGLVLIRVPPMETVAEAEAAIASVAPEAWRASSHELWLREGRLFVFDSAWEGAATAAGIPAEMGTLDVAAVPGLHRVSYASLPYPTGGTYLLVRLSPAAEP